MAVAPGTDRLPRQQAVARRRYLFHAALAVGAAAILLAGPSLGWNVSTIHLVGTACLYAIVVIGVNVVLGFAGQITLGPAATFAVGAYVGGVLSVKYHWNPFLAIIPAVLLALAVGLAIGMPALRVGGFYLAMVTATAALAVPATISIFHGVTGGDDGLSARQLSVGHHVVSDATTFRIIILVTLLSAAVAANISRSAWGGGRCVRAVLRVRKARGAGTARRRQRRRRRPRCRRRRRPRPVAGRCHGGDGDRHLGLR